MLLSPKLYLGALLLLCVLAATGCQARIFAGFTYGGGGKTYSAEPATYRESGEGFQLRVGSPPEGDCYLQFRCSTRTFRQPLTIEGGVVKVSDQDKAQLSSGEVVLQSQQGDLVHGSFDLVAKSSDGREYPVVGSFTAKVQPPK